MDIRSLKHNGRPRGGRRAEGTAPDLAGDPTRGSADGVSARCLENLWVRLKVGDRLRPRDAETLRRLALAPFDRSTVYEVDSRGYVIAVGLPESRRVLDAAALLDAFEARFGVPAGFGAPVWCAAG
jgi:hypothetical protein